MTTLPSQYESRLCIEATFVETLILPLDTQENEDQLILALLSSVTPKTRVSQNHPSQTPLDSGSVSSTIIHHLCFPNFCFSIPKLPLLMPTAPCLPPVLGGVNSSVWYLGYMSSVLT